MHDEGRSARPLPSGPSPSLPCLVFLSVGLLGTCLFSAPKLAPGSPAGRESSFLPSGTRLASYETFFCQSHFLSVCTRSEPRTYEQPGVFVPGDSSQKRPWMEPDSPVRAPQPVVVMIHMYICICIRTCVSVRVTSYCCKATRWTDKTGGTGLGCICFANTRRRSWTNVAAPPQTALSLSLSPPLSPSGQQVPHPPTFLPPSGAATTTRHLAAFY